jgi:hypothetical protein
VPVNTTPELFKMMDKTYSYLLLLLTLFLVSLSLVVNPRHLSDKFFGDGATYYLMAQSIARDGDLRWTKKDYDRCFQDWQRPPEGVILMTPDGGRDVFYGKPYVFSLLAAPFYRLLGLRGFLFLNTLLFLAVATLAFHYLDRRGKSREAFLTVFTFFFLSLPFAYVTWLQPEVFDVLLLFLGYYLWIEGVDPGDEWRSGLFRIPGWFRDLMIGLLFACAGFSRYASLILFLPVIVYAVWRKRWGSLLRTVSYALAVFVLFHLVLYSHTGIVSPYYADRRAFTETKNGFPLVDEGQDFWNPKTVPFLKEDIQAPAKNHPVAALLYHARKKLGLTRGFGQWGVLPVPHDARPVLYDCVFFFVGRYTGVLWYFFPALLCFVEFLRADKERKRVLLLIFSGLNVLFFLVFLRWNYCGGAGFVGNRYFLGTYAVLFFLLLKPLSLRALVPAWLFAGIFLSQILLSPFGIPTADPDEQSHVQNHPFPSLPFETTLGKIPGTEPRFCDPYIIRLADRNATLEGRSLTLQGNTTSEVLIYATERLEEIPLLLQTLSGTGWVKIFDRNQSLQVDFKPGESGSPPGRTLTAQFSPSRTLFVHPVEWIPLPGRDPETALFYIYPIRFKTSSGVVRPPAAPGAYSTYPGFRVAFFREAIDYTQDSFYKARLVTSPQLPSFEAGRSYVIRLFVRNLGTETWSESLFNPVRIGYRWLDADRRPMPGVTGRTPLPRPLPPDSGMGINVDVRTPARPGRYFLVLDLVCENEAWFADVNGRPLFETEVEIREAHP